MVVHVGEEYMRREGKDKKGKEMRGKRRDTWDKRRRVYEIRYFLCASIIHTPVADSRVAGDTIAIISRAGLGVCASRKYLLK